MPAQSIWNDEIVAALKVCVADKKTFHAIGAELSIQFGITISRNAAIGKAKRLGLVCLNEIGKHPRPKKEKKPKAAKKVFRERQEIFVVRRVNGNSPGLKLSKSTEFVYLPPLRCVEIVPRNLTLAELNQATECHYIEGDDHLYCGHPGWRYSVGGVEKQSSYCRAHFEITRQPPRERTENYFAERVSA